MSSIENASDNSGYINYDFRNKGRVVKGECPGGCDIVLADGGSRKWIYETSKLAEVRNAVKNFNDTDHICSVYVKGKCPLNDRFFYSSHSYDVDKAQRNARDQAIQACLKENS